MTSVDRPDDPRAVVDQSQGRWRLGWLFGSVWLVYLSDTVRTAWQVDHLLPRVVGLLSVLLFAVLYVSSWLLVRRLRRAGREVSWRLQLLVIGGGALLTLLAALTAGETALAMTVFLTVLCMFMLPSRLAVATVAGLLVIDETAPRVVPGWTPVDQLGFQVAVTALAMWGVLQLVIRNQQLATAQAEIAQFAVARERDRFARDLHDVLGHSLTVIAVKAELAGRLVALDPSRAEQEIVQVQQLAREALVDVRSAVAGYRETSLAGELVAARAALDAAGIDAELPGAVEHVPGERRELFGWAVREGVTNVVRHSRATRCRIQVRPEAVVVSDDGTGPPEGGVSGGVTGHGLTGLRERADAVGAVLRVGQSDLGGFSMRVGW
jgi:two-component system, NarL family, sensor histidine kinase DesK